jgi:ceramide glucosyltransferase
MEGTELLPLLPTAASAALYVTMHATFVRAIRRAPRGRRPGRAPRVSILKPLAGVDDQLLDNLRSFVEIDHPSFELLLGVASIDDPAWDVARRFAAEAEDGGVDVSVVLTDRNAATNPKVAQLMGLESIATGEVLVISDVNVRVSPSYLWPLLAASRSRASEW